MSIGKLRCFLRFLYPLVMFLIICSSCVIREPEIIIINRIAPEVLVRNPSINGTVWTTVIKYEEATTAAYCMSGEGKIHFQSIDFYRFCREHASHSRIDSICVCDSSFLNEDTSMFDIRPLWSNYNTCSVKEVHKGGFYVLELTMDDMEPDYSAPGPYGH